MKPITWKKMCVFTGVAMAAGLALADDTMNVPTTSTANANYPANNSGMSMLAEPLTAQKFVTDASMCGMEEVYVSQVALQKSSNNDVRDFANRMIKDHTSANNKLTKIAQDEGYTLPPTNSFSTTDPNWNNDLLNRSQIDTIKGQPAQALISTNMPYLANYMAVRQLENTPNAQFDQAYLETMVRDHTMAVNEFESASQTLSDPKLKKFADKTLPTLHKHADMAHQLNDKFGSQSARNDSFDSHATASNLPMNP